VTELGKIMSQFPLEPSLSRTLVQANEEKCVKEVRHRRRRRRRSGGWWYYTLVTAFPL